MSDKRDGEMYLAEDIELDRKVAIKFLNDEFSKDADKLVYVVSTVIHQRLSNDARYQDLLQRMHL